MMTLSADEFIRRFLLHILPMGFHRIRHYGFMANGNRRDGLAKIRGLLNAEDAVPMSVAAGDEKECGQEIPLDDYESTTYICPDCRAAMIIIEILPPCHTIRGPPRDQAFQ